MQQSRKFATQQSHNFAHATLQRNNHTMQPWNTTQPCNATITQPCNVTITQPCDATIMQPKVGVLQDSQSFFQHCIEILNEIWREM
jgi:hypothetical protein